MTSHLRLVADSEEPLPVFLARVRAMSSGTYRQEQARDDAFSFAVSVGMRVAKARKAKARDE